MKFSFLSWNVRHFKGSARRVDEVADLLDGLDPDIFGLIEFQGKKFVRSLIQDHLKDYDFGVTDSKLGLELLIGWRRGKFRQVIFTQRRSFQAGNINLRPGGLVTVRLGNQFYNLLFLHTDSGAAKVDYGNRWKVFRKVWKMEKTLRKLPAQNGQSNLIVIGDLNTMGNGASVTGRAEIRRLGKAAVRTRMRVLDKTHDLTWHKHSIGPRGRDRDITVSDLPGILRSNLDHAIASNGLEFNQLGTTPDGKPAHIMVHGWNQLEGAERVRFVTKISDHSALFGELK
jgi:endonuclease/exonuclease/phosphatase family metal-dependent hydrolase